MSLDAKARVIATVKLVRELLLAFDNLMQTLIKKEQEFGFSTKDTGGMDITKEPLLNALKQELGMERMGWLFLAILSISQMQDDFKNFMTYSTAEKQQFHEKLAVVLENIDKALNK